MNDQHHILDLFAGIGHSDHFKHEHENFDIMGNADHWTNPEVPKKFYAEYKKGFLPKDEIFTMMCPHTRHQTNLLMDLFYHVKDAV
ncbi:hypothetical protein, partial [Neisseria meningitidis]|uniref:hypothetical protein n=1 Tax=Neisseria meningitidis TaxID=487 RepID=UPI001C56408D